MRRLNAGCEMCTDLGGLAEVAQLGDRPKCEQVVEVEVDGHRRLQRIFD